MGSFVWGVEILLGSIGSEEVDLEEKNDLSPAFWVAHGRFSRKGVAVDKE